MEKKNNKMTLDKLAKITQRGFEELRSEFKSDLKNEIGGLRSELKNEMNERFERVDERFERVDEKFERVDEKFERVDERFNQVLDNQDHVLKRLDDLEGDNTMDMVVHRRHGDKLENHEERIVVAEEKLKIVL